MSTDDGSEVVVTVVRLYDGTRAYRLPGGTVVTKEAWADIEPKFRREIIKRDARRIEILSPDCRDGKCAACIGAAWDDEKDAPADCQCACQEEG